MYTTREINWTNDTINILGIDIFHNPIEMHTRNYEKIAFKIDNITKAWYHRNLSL